MVISQSRRSFLKSTVANQLAAKLVGNEQLHCNQQTTSLLVSNNGFGKPTAALFTNIT